MLSSFNRLPSHEMSTILRGGIRIHGDVMSFTYQRSRPPSQFAIIVSAKVDKLAVARNRMKRLVREAVHHLLPSIVDGVHGVFVVRKRLPNTERAVENLVQTMFEQNKLLQEISV